MAVARVELVRNRAELVGARTGEGSNQILEVVATLHEAIRQRIEELRIGGRIGVAHVVLGIHEPPVEEVLPVTVDQSTGEEAVAGTGEPVGQRLAGIVVGRKGHRLLT